MTLKKLLLGSSAVMFAAGAGISTAQAADPNPAGLVVTTMANYVEQCNNGNGWTKKDWCITLAGSIVFSASLGEKITYGSDPWNSTVGPVNSGTQFDIFGQPTTYFSLTPTLTVTVSKPTDAGNLSLIFGVGSSGLTATSLTIGPWQFTANQIRYRNTFGAATITATLAEPGRLGWVDPRAPTSAPTAVGQTGNFAYGPGYSGPWPDFALDVNLDVGAAEITTGFNIGQRTNPTTGPMAGDGVRFVTLGGYLQAALSAGPADLTLRADWDRVNASEDGSGNPVFAYGFRAEAAIDVGNLTITPAFGWSHNYGYYGYKYSEHELGNYLYAALNVSAPLGEQLTLTTGVEFTRGPDHAFDAVIEANAGLRFEPDAASPLYVTLVGKYQRQLGAQQLSAWNVTLSVGAAF